MNEITKKNEKKELKISNKHFEILLKICLIIGIIIVSGFIIYYVFTPESGYVTFGILDENQETDYPTEASINETIFFYVTVENYLNRDFTFRVEILKGDNNTIVTSSGSFNATSYFNTTKTTILHNQFWMSEMLNVSFSQPGADQRIIIEFWEIPSSGIEKYWEDLHLWLTILP